MLLLMSLMLCLGMAACTNGNNVPDVTDNNGTAVNNNETLPDKLEDTMDNDANDLTDKNNVNNGNTTVTP